MKKIILGIFLVFVFIVPCVSCAPTKTQINEVVTNFITAYQNEQYSECLDYLSNHLRTAIGDQTLINRMQFKRLFSGSAQLKSIGEPSINGNIATVWVDTQGLIGTNTTQLTLLKENGHWKIDGF
jgi:hypothetical protein